MRKQTLYRLIWLALVLVLLLAPASSVVEAGTFYPNCNWGVPVLWVGVAWGYGPVTFRVGWVNKSGGSGTQTLGGYLTPGENTYLIYPLNSNTRIVSLTASSYVLSYDTAGCGGITAAPLKSEEGSKASPGPIKITPDKITPDRMLPVGPTW